MKSFIVTVLAWMLRELATVHPTHELWTHRKRMLHLAPREPQLLLVQAELYLRDVDWRMPI